MGKIFGLRLKLLFCVWMAGILVAVMMAAFSMSGTAFAIGEDSLGTPTKPDGREPLGGGVQVLATHRCQDWPLVIEYGGFGDALPLWSAHYSDTLWAGVFSYTVPGEDPGEEHYEGYCIDLFTVVTDSLTNGPLHLDSRSWISPDNWCSVNYILHTYSYTDPTWGGANQDVRAAAVQSAIWYYVTENDPRGGQFLTDPTDGIISPTVWYSPTTPGEINEVRTLALGTIIPAADSACTGIPYFAYPSTVELTPETSQVDLPSSVDFTATVRDQQGAVMPGIQVSFNTSGGLLSATTDSTDGSGEATTTLSVTVEGDYTVWAWVTERQLYGTLILGYPDTQNVATTSLLPCSITDTASVQAVTHDGTVYNQTADQSVYTIGEDASICASVQNLGPAGDDFLLDVWVEDSGGLTYPVTSDYALNDMGAGEVLTPCFSWDTTGMAAGTYNIHARVSIVGQVDGNPGNDVCENPAAFQLQEPPQHDAEAAEQGAIDPSVVVGDVASLRVTVRNHGDETEDLLLDVWVEDTHGHNYTVADDYPVNNLPSGQERIVYFGWDTTGRNPGTYSIHAHVTIVGYADGNPANDTCSALAQLTLLQAALGAGWVIPEANTMMLLASGVMGLGGYIGYLRKRSRSR